MGKFLENILPLNVFSAVTVNKFHSKNFISFFLNGVIFIKLYSKKNNLPFIFQHQTCRFHSFNVQEM